MNRLLVKPGVEFGVIAPGGFVILASILQTSKELAVDLTITSGSDGLHSGFEDPHHRLGDLKEKVITSIMALLGDKFYGFIENLGLETEHFHIQVAKGTTYP